ncbi:MAG TPA: selenocysteine-specific translation elongation factor [Geminicoccaceae bacterium]|nr:selenocysteine-specific translation elongation factor [Geminicoccaceae bacterium]
MRTLLAGVIGHVDHGKTALVKALTGIDTDRLKEERERGVSIVLGFSHLAVPGGGEIDLIDMPGHERFVRTMISGATGIEAVLLVVDANEGVRPQTIEHVEIARLIGVRRGAIAVTKCDLAAPDRARQVAEEARSLAAATGLGDMRYVLTSAATGDGLDDLARRLADLMSDDAERVDHGCCYLPVDRVFAVAGFGTVVTGTLRRGRIAVGDEVEVLPGGLRARVRGLKVHGRPADAIEPGRRAAVNLRGVEWTQLRRGQALATPGTLALSRWLDAEFTLIASAPRPLENNQVVRLLFGTTETSARVRLLDRDRLAPGASALAQLRCGEDVAVPAREPFIVRAHSPVRTIGGGRVLDPSPSRRRRFDDGAIRYLRVVAEDRPSEVIAARLLVAGHRGCRLDELARLVGFSPARVRPWVREAGAEVFGDGTALHGDACRDLRHRLLAGLGAFHREHPGEPGLAKERLRALLPEGTAGPVFGELTAKLVDRGLLARERGVVRRADFRPPRAVRPEDGLALAREVEEAFRRGGLAPPDVREVAGSDPRRHEAVRTLAREGRLVRTLDRVQKREIVFHREAVARAKRLLADALSGEAGFSVSEAGQVLGISRKYGVPLLEYLDSVSFTRRADDRRVVVARRRAGASTA